MTNERRLILQRNFRALLDEWETHAAKLADGAAAPLMEVTVFFRKDHDTATAITLSISVDEIGIGEVPRARLEE